MVWKMKKTLPFIAVMIVAGLLCWAVAPCVAWETKDPQVAEEYAKFMGWNAKDKVGKVAPEVKAGTVIDSSNYKNYPGLQELLPKCLYDRFDPKSYAPLAPMKIKETDEYHLGAGWIKKSQESAKTAHIGSDGLTLEGYVGGYPFINPKRGVELVQWCDQDYLGDTFAMRPMRLRLYGRDNKPEREMRQHLNCIRFMSCTDWRLEGIQPNPEEISYANSGTFIYPRDISGTAYVRKRYVPADKPDEFLLYVSSMRRIRRMSGRDTQDPLFGSDLVWDDYNCYWQKLSTTEFPNEYKMLPAKEMLLPTLIDYDWPNDRASAGYTDYKVDETGDQCFLHYGSWQRRWVYPIEIISKDSAYLYSKRVLITEPQICVQVQTENYDQGGRLWRSWVRDYNLAQTGVGIMEELIDIVDHVNSHRTILDFKGEKNPKWMGAEYADVRFLSKKAK